MSNNSFGNNSAQYGADIASIPYKIVEQDTMNDQIYLSNVPSGLRHDSSIKLMLVDMEGQVMNLENVAVAKIRRVSTQSKILGVDSALFTGGMATVNSMIFAHYPGANSVQFNIFLTNSDTQINSTPLLVSFRH